MQLILPHGLALVTKCEVKNSFVILCLFVVHAKIYSITQQQIEQKPEHIPYASKRIRTRRRKESKISHSDRETEDSNCLTKCDHFSVLPLEMQQHIFLLLPLPYILRLSMVCKDWNRIIDGSSSFWHKIFTIRFGSPPLLELNWKERCTYFILTRIRLIFVKPNRRCGCEEGQDI